MPPYKSRCKHKHYYAGHCGEMSCWNYISKCQVHWIIGEADAVCTHAGKKPWKP